MFPGLIFLLKKAWAGGPGFVVELDPITASALSGSESYSKILKMMPSHELIPAAPPRTKYSPLIFVRELNWILL